MPKKSIRSIKLTGRITESKSPIEDIKFVEKKLKQGVAQAAIIRQAVNILRKHEEGKLYNKENPNENMKLKDFQDQKEDNQNTDQKDEEQMDEEKAKKLESNLERKLQSNNFL